MLLRVMAKQERAFLVRARGEVPAGECQQRRRGGRGGSYTLVGGIILLGGLRLPVGQLAGNVSLGLLLGSDPRYRGRFYELVKTIYAQT